VPASPPEPSPPPSSDDAEFEALMQRLKVAQYTSERAEQLRMSPRRPQAQY